MLKRSTFLHLRIPFSFFLMPVYLFALSLSDNIRWPDAILTFVILHFFLYPASNGYNSYFDKDKESIGALEHPPPVSKQLYYLSLILDAIAMILGLLISVEFAVMLMIYGMVSKAYSHPAIRLKKYAFTGWIIAGLFQGFFTFLMAYTGINDSGIIKTLQWDLWLPAILSTLLLWGSYPITQIYQHKEDSRRGDETLSRKLGVLGTFHFTAMAFLFADAGFILFYSSFFSLWPALVFQIFLLPVFIYFISWYFKVIENPEIADFRHTMRLNMISAGCMNAFFLFFLFFGR